MGDEVDRANEEAEQALGEALRARRPVPQATGECVWCADVAAPGAAFCGPDCREVYEHAQRMRRIEGRAA